MARHMRPVVILMVALASLVSACGGGTSLPVEYRNLDGPVLVASTDGGGLDVEWQRLEALSEDLDALGPDAGAIAGFETFNDPRIALTDGRFIVKGQSDDDEPIAGWYQRNPAMVQEGEDNPVIPNEQRPVRVFVYDPADGSLQPLSPIPAVHDYTTAVSMGASPDAVLEVVVLSGETAVAFTSGFNGAAYDIPYEIWVSPIPTR